MIATEIAGNKAVNGTSTVNLERTYGTIEYSPESYSLRNTKRSLGTY